MDSNIKKYTFKPGLPQEFEIVDMAPLYKMHVDKLTSTHRTGFYHILWFKKGTLTHLVDFKPIEIKPNTILFLNKDIVQRFDGKGEFEGKGILFTDSFFCKTAADTKFLRSTILFNDLFNVSKIQFQEPPVFLVQLFDLMEAELKIEKDHCQSDILKNHLHNLLLYSERERRKHDFTEAKKGPDLDYVLLFKNLLEDHFKKHKQVGHYAKQLSVTEKRLNQATAKVLGQSPKEIIDERVMLEAKRLLAHTNESVKEIGFEMGFDEPTNFIKYFRKHSKATPIEFREQFG